MKAVVKKHLFLIIMLLEILGLVIVNTLGVFYIYVLQESYTAFEFLFGFFYIFVFQLFGIAFVGYEGRGTPMNMLINGLFYLFIIAIIISVILFVKQQSNKIRK